MPVKDSLHRLLCAVEKEKSLKVIKLIEHAMISIQSIYYLEFQFAISFKGIALMKLKAITDVLIRWRLILGFSV